MSGLQFRVSLVLVAAVILFTFAIARSKKRANKCESLGGVYVHKINKCMKKEYFIN